MGYLDKYTDPERQRTLQREAKKRYMANPENRRRQNVRQLAWWRRNKDKAHVSSVVRKYGMTASEYRSLLEKQSGKCAICQRTPDESDGRRLHVDHNHTTNKNRGLLCGNCNRGIGLFEENRERILRAIEYLGEWEGLPN